MANGQAPPGYVPRVCYYPNERKISTPNICYQGENVLRGYSVGVLNVKGTTDQLP